MVTDIHHINFLVRDLEAAIPKWEQILGRSIDRRDRLDGRNVDLAQFLVDGTWIVLVQPTGPGVPADHLEANGEGFFLLSFGVDSLDAETRRIGVELLQGEERAGLDDWRVQDLDRGQTFGAQLQLVES